MKGHKHRLELNNKQKTLAFKHVGVARHAYNWGVDLCRGIENKRGKLPSAIDLHKLLVRDVKSENEWYYKVSKYSPQQALRDLSTSYTNFFRKLKSGEVERKRKAYIKSRKSKGLPIKKEKLDDMCKPNFKKKGVRDNFYLEGNIIIKGNKIKIPKFGWVKMSESYNETFNVKNVTISRCADYFFISFKRELEDVTIKGIKKKKIIGIDLGVKTLATLSDGFFRPNLKPFKQQQGKLRIAQRVVSKRYNENKNYDEQSKNYEKAKKRVAKIHYKISCIRKDSLHKLTTYLAKNHSLIGVEDLNVSGMMKNRRLSGAIQDGGFFEFRRQLEYKTKWYGSELVVIDRYFPSSKTCSCCGNIKKDLKLSDRIYNCDNCGFSIDRDLNAAINIKELAESWYATACGELYKPDYDIVRNFKKQEINSKMLSFV